MAIVRRIAIAATLMLGLAAGTASACPEDILLFDFHEDPPEPISTATIIVGTGYTDLGLVGSIAVGYVGGERSGWLFRGAHVKRVLVGAERRHRATACRSR